ncbi:MAG: ImmA/IrrE family metallo-endopeptidase [Chloroflexi bacterium]|nr:ImmA/IrrE family metallo-endopeptidase [Chloroflexota bacterium]
MTTAFITPELITWARNRAKLTQGEVANSVNVSEDIVSNWEAGDARPTLRQAERLAQRLYIPFGYLFLSTPPSVGIPLPDLRTVQGGHISDPSPEFYDVLNDALRKQDWYKTNLLEDGIGPLSFIGRYSLNASTEVVSKDIENTLAISTEIRPQSSNWEEFLTRLMEKSEDIGVLVLRNSIVGNNTHRHLSVDEFRGFVISDDLAPLIFLNGSDAKSAQIFTLVHELAHLWLGESGVSNPDYRRRSQEQNNPIERICDSIAAETLVPENTFLSGWNERASTEINLRNLTRYFKVSQVVTLRRAYGLGKISGEEFSDYYLNRIAGNSSANQGGGDFRRNVLVRNSRTFTTTLVESVLNGRTSEREAARLLNLRIPSFDRFTSWMAGVT